MAFPTIVESTGREGGRAGYGGTEYSRSFTVVASSQSHALELLASTVPYNLRRGVIYVDERGTIIDSLLRLEHFEVYGSPPAPVNGSGLYHVRAVFGYASGFRAAAAAAPRQPQESGLAEPLWDVREIAVPVDTVLSGVPVQNSAGEPLSPQLTKIVTSRDLVLSFLSEAYASVIAAQTAYDPYVGSLNLDPVYGFPAARFRMRPPRVHDTKRLTTTGTARYLQIELRLEYRPPVLGFDGTPFSGFTELRHNMGHRKRTAAGATTYDLLRDEQGVPLNRPALLNGSGTGLLPSGQTPVTLIFDMYPRLSWPANLLPTLA